MKSCPTCSVLLEEVRWLRSRVEALGHAPAPMAARPALPDPQAAPAIESFTDEHGQAWVSVNGGAVKLEDYDRFMRREVGAIFRDGTVVPREEVEAASEMLDQMVNGGRLT